MTFERPHSGVSYFSNYGVLTGAQQIHVIYTITRDA